MFCAECGKEITGGGAFCQYCGAKTSDVQESVSTISSQATKRPVGIISKLGTHPNYLTKEQNR